MEVTFASSFSKSFRHLIGIRPEMETIFWQRIELFIENPFHPLLKTHKLSGQLKDCWSFSIDYDCRIIFYFTSDKPKKAVFVDIGKHDEVY
jgi:mRNA-degrading endonuclease YafQ of YafQ-DinJ toxin-antitoxin module